MKKFDPSENFSINYDKVKPNVGKYGIHGAFGDDICVLVNNGFRNLELF